MSEYKSGAIIIVSLLVLFFMWVQLTFNLLISMFRDIPYGRNNAMHSPVSISFSSSRTSRKNTLLAPLAVRLALYLWDLATDI